MAEARVEGVVVAKKCGCCGHHEIGVDYLARDKQGLEWPGYRQLKPGDKIILIVEVEDDTGREKTD
jgi:hypothetical protein